jgi:esterase/lipase
MSMLNNNFPKSHLFPTIKDNTSAFPKYIKGVDYLRAQIDDTIIAIDQLNDDESYADKLTALHNKLQVQEKALKILEKNRKLPILV